MENSAPEIRDIVFISKATPEDNEFALWLAPKLEAAGYKVFADVINLQGGDRWRNEITHKLQNKTAKVLLVCKNSTLVKDGVREEIGMALDVSKRIGDKNFIIPIRLERYEKVFGIGELQYIDFERGWAQGLRDLLENLRRQKVPRNERDNQITPTWEAIKRKSGIDILAEPESLTLNWLRIAEVPNQIYYYEIYPNSNSKFTISDFRKSKYPVIIHGKGILTYRSLEELILDHDNHYKIKLIHQIDFMEFSKKGFDELNIRPKEANNYLVTMLRLAWETFCVDKKLQRFQYASQLGFHANSNSVKIGKKIPWGIQGQKRSAMLRNVSKGSVWEFGITAIPSLFPFPHFKLKTRVLFSPSEELENTSPYLDPEKQHRLRRRICKGWRNKQWHGRMRAFLELLSEDSAFITLEVGETAQIKVDAIPIFVSSPVSTTLPNDLDDDYEETDASTLGRPDMEEQIA